MIHSGLLAELQLGRYLLTQCPNTDFFYLEVTWGQRSYKTSLDLRLSGLLEKSLEMALSA